MKLQRLFTTVFLFFCVTGFAQINESDAAGNPSETRYFVKDYPDGFYKTMDDFINKKRVPYPLLKKTTLRGQNPLPFDKAADQLFFSSKSDSTEINNVFAISFRGSLYIQQKFIVKYAKKGNRNDEGSDPKAYHRVLKDGKFLYLEGNFSNFSGTGLAIGMGAFGVIGGMIMASSMRGDLNGAIFDVKNKEFVLFKNCENFNLFLTEQNAEQKLDCKQKKFSIEKVREIIDLIIK